MKKRKLILGVIAIFILVSIGGILLYFHSSKEKDTDSIKFSKEYTNIQENNVFVYRSASEIINIMEHGTGVVYLGFPECPWCQAYVKYLNEVALEVGIDKIYYFNILESRKNNTEEYQKIVSLLGDKLQYDKEGNPRIYVPNISFHVKGNLIGNDCETSLDTHNLKDPNEYWTEDEVNDLKSRLKTYMEEVFTSSNLCTDCNK